MAQTRELIGEPPSTLWESFQHADGSSAVFHGLFEKKSMECQDGSRLRICTDSQL